MPSAQVHRFRDTVAAYLGAGPTTYLTPREALALARALTRAARSCESESFAASTCGTVTVPLAGTDAHTVGEVVEAERGAQALADLRYNDAGRFNASPDYHSRRRPWTLTHEPEGLQPGQRLTIAGRFTSQASAESYLATSAAVDPDELHAGRYGIDGPGER